MIPRRMLRIALALLFIGGACRLISAELPPARRLFRSFGIAQGLENLAVTAMVQDPEGFLWVGTQGNIFRFDGQRFQSFGLKEGLPSGYITALATATGQSLWAGTWKGLALLEGGRFRVVPFPGAMPLPRINGMAFDRSGRLWVAASSGAFLLEPGGTPTALPGWTGGEALAVCPGSKGIWFSSGSSVMLLTPQGRWRKPVPDPSPERERILDLLEHPDGRLLARSSTHVWLLERGAKGFLPLKTGFETSSQIGSRCCLGPEGQVWVPTDQGLLALQGATVTRVGRREGLPVASPWAILVDREGSLWVGGQGIHRELGNGTWACYTTQEGLPHEEVWAVLRDGGGRLWVGTSLGIALATPTGWKVPPGSPREAIRSLIEGPDGDIWAGTAHGEIVLMAPAGRIRNRIRATNGLRTHKILSLCRHEGSVWVGTDGGGLFRIAQESGAWRATQEPLGPWGPERVNQVVSAPSGRLWVATEHGIALRHQGSWRHFDRSHGLLQDHVSCLSLSGAGELRAAYFEPIGVSRFRIGSEGTLTQLAHWDSGRHLASGTVYSLGEDAAGRLWVGTGRGVAVFQGEERIHFGSQNGLVGEDCNALAFLAEPDGKVWVGTSSGLAHFTGKGPIAPPPPPGVLLVSARLGSQPLPTLGPQPTRVSHRENDLYIQFAGTSFIHADQLEFAYRFGGSESGPWKSTRSRDLHITALAPGDYTLKLRSRLGREEWGPERELRFSIEAAWWQWGWLKGLGIAVVLGVLAKLISWHVQNLKQRNQELETLLKLSDTLAQELESANLNLQEQTLTDPLTGLKNRRFLEAIIPRDLAEVERMHREEEGPAPNMDLLFLMVDIDHFKWVNDHYGHQAGDAVLQQFADVLRTATRGSDTVIRYGGEEFLILARQTRREDAIILAERIRKSAENRRFTLPSGELVQRTCSVGFAPYPVCENNLKAVPWRRVLEFADQCLYQAKEEGRNRWMGLLPRHRILNPAPELLPQDLESLLHMGYLQMVSSHDSKAPEGAQADR